MGDIHEYAARAEAFRTAAVNPDAWDWRDDLAATVWAQRDYDERRLASLANGAPMAPSQGWSFTDRVLARGAVDAVLSGLQKFGITDVGEALAQLSPQEVEG